MIELRHISKRFGPVQALDDVSLSIAPGERLALVGENGAGKSSLMNVLYGLYQPDSGSVTFDGASVVLKRPSDAMARGIGMVHQHFTLVPTLTVFENVVLGAEPTRWGLVVDAERARTAVSETCLRLGFVLDVNARVSTLTVGAQQKVEIVKALHRGARTLILDEPTAVLTPAEAEDLLRTIERLSSEGVTVVLISHKLRDVLRIANRVVVLRRGAAVADVRADATTADALAEAMVGRAVTPTNSAQSEARAPVGATAVLSVEALHSAPLHDVRFTVNEREIVGIAGVDGNGQRELAEVLTGLRPWTSGTITVANQTHTSLSPRAARDLGIAHVPEDRLRRAMIGDLSLEENVALGQHHRPPFAQGRLVNIAGRRTASSALLQANDVRPPDPTLRAAALSGGNQQKLVVGRELATQPRCAVVVQPTRGLDLVAVEAVRTKLLAHRANGGATVLISLDLDELLALADRIVVLFEGRVTGTFARADFDEQRIGRCMLGVRDA